MDPVIPGLITVLHHRLFFRAPSGSGVALWGEGGNRLNLAIFGGPYLVRGGGVVAEQLGGFAWNSVPPLPTEVRAPTEHRPTGGIGGGFGAGGRWLGRSKSLSLNRNDLSPADEGCSQAEQGEIGCLGFLEAHQHFA